MNNSDTPSLKFITDPDALMKTDINTLDENHPDLFMDAHHNLTSTSQLISTSMDNLNSNSQSGFGHFFSSTSFGIEGHENNDLLNPTAVPTTATDSSTTKKRKKSDKDLKSVRKKRKIILID